MTHAPQSITLPPGWLATTLENVTVIRDDLRQPVNAEERAKRTGPHPYYGATGQVGWIDGYLIDGENVLLGEDGAPFLDPSKPKAYKVTGKAWVNNHAHILKPVDNLTDIRFLLHSLNAIDYRQFVNGTTRLKLTQAAMRQIPIHLAPLPEQHRIVAEIERQFSLLDAGIANLKRVQANLKRYRASVLQAACEGRLVPTEAAIAQAEGRDYEPADVLLTRILAERRARWEAEQLAKKKPSRLNCKDPEGEEESSSLFSPVPPELGARGPLRKGYKEPAAPETKGLAVLPEGWVWATAEQLSDENRAITYGVVKLGEHFAKGIPVLRSSNVRHLRLDLSGIKSISREIANDYKRTFLKGKEVLVTVRGTLGGVVAVPATCVGYNISREVAMIVAVEEKIVSFLALFIGSSGAQRWIARNTKGIAYTGLNIETLKEMPIALPPLAEQERIVAEVERRLSVVDNLEQVVKTNLKRAERVRQAILKEAFAGRLVPQDPNDEPASVLLERITAEREAQSKIPTRPKPTAKKQRPNEIGDKALLNLFDTELLAETKPARH